nr:4-(cytidine 5'-diphospho)-2-C-methyl-D-erythritol kinase [uncultured Desulfobulbus sp.]
MIRQTLTVQAPAKVNLFLKVLGRRDDGYHLLATHMQKIGLYDTLELKRAASGIRLHCPGSVIPEDRGNLVFRAAELFFDRVAHNGFSPAPGVEITLHKNIPVAAGLGGGSSDAAATLVGLDTLFATDCPQETIAHMGLQLGADVPFFTNDSPSMLATGIGEILQPVAPLQGYRVLLVNPGFSVSTRWVYQNFALTESGDSVTLQSSQDAVAVFLGAGYPQSLANDLEKVTVKKYPELSRIKRAMLERGADGVLMSGSGPTVFGIYQDCGKAEEALEAFRQEYRQVFLLDPLQ